MRLNIHSGPTFPILFVVFPIVHMSAVTLNTEWIIQKL